MIPKRVIKAAMKEISRRFHCSLAGYDRDGHPLAHAGKEAGRPSAETVQRFARSSRQRAETEGATLLKVEALSEPVMILAVYDTKDQAAVTAAEMAFDLLLYHQRDRFDTEEFLRNLFLGVIPPSDMEACAAELGLDQPCRRLVYAAAFDKHHAVALIDHLTMSLQTKLKDLVLSIRHSKVLVIHEALEDEEAEEQALGELEQIISETISELTEQPARIGCGCYAEDIASLRRSYEEAVAAIETGRMFNPQDTVHRYEELVIEHLVRHLPKTFSQWFLKHSFSEGFFDDLDEEMARTATVFLDNTMNSAETSKQLYFHRNTLRYRLKNIRGQSGLDLRKFQDASLFKLGWAIHRYARENEVRDSEEVL